MIMSPEVNHFVNKRGKRVSVASDFQVSWVQADLVCQIAVLVFEPIRAEVAEYMPQTSETENAVREFPSKQALVEEPHGKDQILVGLFCQSLSFVIRSYDRKGIVALEGIIEIDWFLRFRAHFLALAFFKPAQRDRWLPVLLEEKGVP